MRTRAVAVVLLVAGISTAGCEKTNPTYRFAEPTQDVRDEPVAWSASYNDKFDTVARCLVTRAQMDSQGLSVMLSALDFGSGTARVTVSRSGGASRMLGAYSIRRVADLGAELDWRQRGAPFGRLSSGDDAFGTWARQLADNCGKR